MPTLVITETGSNDQAHDYSDVSTIVTQIKTWANSTKLDYVNLQDNGIRPSKIRANSGQEHGRTYVRNDTGGAFAVGDLVYFSGRYATDSIPNVTKADATSGTVLRANAVVVEVIADAANGTVATEYELASLNTSGGSVGDPVYLSTTAGGWTLTEPTGTNMVQVVGTIAVSHASAGRIAFNVSPGSVQDKTIAGDVTFGDDDKLQFGDGLDYWFMYDATGTNFELRSSDVDGGGTDGDIFSVQDGTNDITFAGIVTATGIVAGATGSTFGTLTLADGSITDSSAAISFGNENLSTTGTLASGALTVTGAILSNADDGGALGASGTGFSDLFLASGAVLNFNAGAETITHSANTLTVGGTTTFDFGAVATVDFDGATAFTNGASTFTFTPTTDTHFSNGTGVVIGHTAQLAPANVTGEFQMLGSGEADATMQIGRWSANSPGPQIIGYKSRNASIGGTTKLNSGDVLLDIFGYGDDGNDLTSFGARIQFEVDGDTGTGDMPGRILFHTTADGAASATERMRIDSAGNVGIGVTPTLTHADWNGVWFGGNGTVHYQPAAAASNQLVISQNAYIASGGSYTYISTDETSRYSMSDGRHIFASAASGTAGNTITFSEVMRMDLGGSIYIGDIANANMTVGLTINQGTNDDEAFALKSSDVAHGLTQVDETDTYFSIHKRSSTFGGVLFRVMSEDDASANNWQAVVEGGTATTAKTTSGSGLIDFIVREHDGANTVANITADGNIFTLRAQVGGSILTRFLIDEDGDMLTVVAGGTFDFEPDGITERDDVALLSAFDYTTSGGEGLIKSEFEDYMKYKEKDLIDAGILGDTIANDGMWCISQHVRAQTGAIRQLGRTQGHYEQRIEQLESRLKLLAKAA